MNPLTVVLAVLKGMAFIDNRKGVEKATNKDRSAWLSRRAIHGVIFAVSSLAALVTGVDLPPSIIEAVTSTVSPVVDLFMDNKKLFFNLWAALGILIGTLKRKKS